MIKEIMTLKEINSRIIIFNESDVNKIRKFETRRIKYIEKHSALESIGIQIVDEVKRMNNKVNFKRVEKYLLHLGFSVSAKGTYYLKECILLYLQQEQSECNMKELFDRVAIKNKIT